MLKRHSTARLIGFAQIFLSSIFLGGYFAVLFCLLAGWIKTPPDWKDALMVMLGVLTGSVGTIITFWFNRSRAQGTPVKDADHE